MNLSFDAGAFALGCGGALGHEALRWIAFRMEQKLPVYFHKLHYWLLTCVLILLGGALASLLELRSVLQAMAFGILAPSILSRLATLAPSGDELTLAAESAEMALPFAAARTSIRDFQ